ncbi:hypothetical protein D9613_002752 [Agrocybe pediades]|uniref:Mitochondrial outer membrane transport complex Sam37/metaxin N-terminal domain-containing protein n=1 Tax=Agrocybe pediades TaxID=84607 RepID=A0A8H4QRF0_9AGAR|nr:hypothetical protein D9613_002752 [Agrocybe pediades]
MDESLPSPSLILHVWPGQWGLPSFDPLCLAAVLYLQIAIPGKFSLKECSNPDASPSGQLPFLVHDQHVSTSFESIVKYVSGLRESDYEKYEHANLDITLNATQRSKRVAWFAHAESHLADLVYHNIYANVDNWSNVTLPALAAIFPVPQKYYVPRRMRDSYFPRLEASGLWKSVVEEEKPTEKPFPRDVRPAEKKKLSNDASLSLAFDKEKTLTRARAELDIYAELIGDQPYTFGQRVSSLDVLIAAHVLLLIYPLFPDTLLKDLLIQSYPSLVALSRRVHAVAFESGNPDIMLAPAASSLWALLPSWPGRQKPAPKDSNAPEDIHYTHMRWGFVGLAVGSLLAYLVLVGRQYTVTWQVAGAEGEVEEEEETLEETTA